MPSRSFTSGRKFSTTTSAFATRRLKAASPCGDFRSSVMPRLLRWRFWKSEPSLGPPGPSPSDRCGGVSILTILAPQSPSCRTQVGPERTRVRSRTVKRERASEARENGMSNSLQPVFLPALGGFWGPTFPDNRQLVYCIPLHSRTPPKWRTRNPLHCGVEHICHFIHHSAE